MAKKTKRYFAIAFTTKDGRDLFARNLQYNLPRGSVLGAWHSKSSQKKRIEYGKCGFKSAFGCMESLYDYFVETSNYETENIRAFIVEISGRIDVDWDMEMIASENMRFVKEIKPFSMDSLCSREVEDKIVTEDELGILTSGTVVARI